MHRLDYSVTADIAVTWRWIGVKQAETSCEIRLQQFAEN